MDNISPDKIYRKSIEDLINLCASEESTIEEIISCIEQIKVEERKIGSSIIDNSYYLNDDEGYEVYNENELNALDSAIASGRTEVVGLLLKNGADIQKRSFEGSSHLCYAKTTEMIELLLNRYPSIINEPDDDQICNEDSESKPCSLRYSALHNFVSSNRTNIELAQFLIEKGADINIKDRYGTTPLALAIKSNNIEMVEMLLQKCADFSLSIDVTIDGEIVERKFPIHYAKSLGIFRLLVEYGAETNVVDSYGEPAIHSVVRNIISKAKESGSEQEIQGIDDKVCACIDYFKEKHINLAQVDQEGNNLLHILAKEDKWPWPKTLTALTTRRVAPRNDPESPSSASLAKRHRAAAERVDL